jgi:hypothetical protein
MKKKDYNIQNLNISNMETENSNLDPDPPGQQKIIFNRNNINDYHQRNIYRYYQLPTVKEKNDYR